MWQEMEVPTSAAMWHLARIRNEGGQMAGSGEGADDGAALPAHVRVAIIGAGFGGLGTGIRLRKAGACDVPSHLYSFSFAPNPAWSRSFSRQPEIWQYLDDVSERYALGSHIRFAAEVTQADWDAHAARWMQRPSRADLAADVLISSAGPLSEPSPSDVPGLASFPGEVFHSARWNHGCDLTGKRV